MSRTLLIVIVLYVIWRVLYAYGRRMDRRSRGAEDFSKFSAKRRDRVGEREAQPVSGGELVSCSGCGVLTPRDGSGDPPTCGQCRAG
jgi:hypothetical protein